MLEHDFACSTKIITDPDRWPKFSIGKQSGQRPSTQNHKTPLDKNVYATHSLPRRPNRLALYKWPKQPSQRSTGQLFFLSFCAPLILNIENCNARCYSGFVFHHRWQESTKKTWLTFSNVRRGFLALEWPFSIPVSRHPCDRFHIAMISCDRISRSNIAQIFYRSSGRFHSSHLLTYYYYFILKTKLTASNCFLAIKKCDRIYGLSHNIQHTK